jgi:hypothetical protein
MRDNDEDRFFHEWQRHEKEQLDRATYSQCDHAKPDREWLNTLGNIAIGIVLGIALALIIVQELTK